MFLKNNFGHMHAHTHTHRGREGGGRFSYGKLIFGKKIRKLNLNRQDDKDKSPHALMRYMTVFQLLMHHLSDG